MAPAHVSPAAHNPLGDTPMPAIMPNPHNNPNRSPNYNPTPNPSLTQPSALTLTLIPTLTLTINPTLTITVMPSQTSMLAITLFWNATSDAVVGSTRAKGRSSSANALGELRSARCVPSARSATQGYICAVVAVTPVWCRTITGEIYHLFGSPVDVLGINSLHRRRDSS